MSISNVYNVGNYKSTYIRSSGVIGIRKKINKHTKLISVLLPSKNIKNFPNTTLAMFSALSNLYTNKLVEGG